MKLVVSHVALFLMIACATILIAERLGGYVSDVLTQAVP